MKNINIHVCAKTVFVTNYWQYFSPVHLHALVGVGSFTKDGWFACAPTAYEVSGPRLSKVSETLF
jgi:hypothetical protein